MRTRALSAAALAMLLALSSCSKGTRLLVSVRAATAAVEQTSLLVLIIDLGGQQVVHDELLDQVSATRLLGTREIWREYSFGDNAGGRAYLTVEARNASGALLARQQVSVDLFVNQARELRVALGVQVSDGARPDAGPDAAPGDGPLADGPQVEGGRDAPAADSRPADRPVDRPAAWEAPLDRPRPVDRRPDGGCPLVCNLHEECVYWDGGWRCVCTPALCGKQGQCNPATGKCECGDQPACAAPLSCDQGKDPPTCCAEQGQTCGPPDCCSGRSCEGEEGRKQCCSPTRHDCSTDKDCCGFAQGTRLCGTPDNAQKCGLTLGQLGCGGSGQASMDCHDLHTDCQADDQSGGRSRCCWPRNHACDTSAGKTCCATTSCRGGSLLTPSSDGRCCPPVGSACNPADSLPCCDYMACGNGACCVTTGFGCLSGTECCSGACVGVSQGGRFCA